VRPLSLIVAVVIALAPASAQQIPLEYQVKAAYLYNFVKFVQWPAPARSGPINICLAGRNPFGTVLAETIRDEIVDNRPLTSRVILEPESDCHVLFIPDGAPLVYLRAAHETPTLTVGETADFLMQGGIISFVNDGPNVRFAISSEAADRVQLQVSSRLLRLAINARSNR